MGTAAGGRAEAAAEARRGADQGAGRRETEAGRGGRADPGAGEEEGAAAVAGRQRCTSVTSATTPPNRNWMKSLVTMAGLLASGLPGVLRGSPTSYLKIHRTPEMP